MKNKVFIFVFLVNLLFSPLTGQSPDSRPQTPIADSLKKSFRLFEDVNPLEISLRFDLSNYLRTKPKEDYLKAIITFHLSKTDSIIRDIRLRTRGIFRNQYCTFSPIELNFKNAGFGYSDLDRISKLKLVPECRYGSENGSYVLREYLAYKLFNVFTDTSFRVRLLTINYIDSEKKRKPLTRYGFFIEPTEILAARINCIQINSRTLTQKSIVPAVMDRLAIFNYMIGNYDWAVPGQHNVKIFKSMVIDSVKAGIAIPYDFDWTGLVNADYAIPAENVGTQNVRERLFEGVCRTKEVYEQHLRIFLNKKEALYKVINEFPYLNVREKKDITGYLDGFFNQIEGRKDLAEFFTETCKRF